MRSVAEHGTPVPCSKPDGTGQGLRERQAIFDEFSSPCAASSNQFLGRAVQYCLDRSAQQGEARRCVGMRWLRHTSQLGENLESQGLFLGLDLIDGLALIQRKAPNPNDEVQVPFLDGEGCSVLGGCAENCVIANAAGRDLGGPVANRHLGSGKPLLALEGDRDFFLSYRWRLAWYSPFA